MSSLKGELVRAGKLLVLPTLVLAVVAWFVPGRAGIAVRVFALVLLGGVVVLMVAALRRAFPRATPLRPRAKPPRPVRATPETLARLETRTALGVAGAFDLHYRLRPRLRGLAAELLASRRAISLDENPDRARQALGEETWLLVREDRPPPEDRIARGIPIRELARVVESLENV